MESNIFDLYKERLQRNLAYLVEAGHIFDTASFVAHLLTCSAVRINRASLPAVSLSVRGYKNTLLHNRRTGGVKKARAKNASETESFEKKNVSTVDSK